MKILVCDPISPQGIAVLQQRPEFQVEVLPRRLSEAELLPVVTDAVALLVRSETKVTRKVLEAAPPLRVVGRAGVGVDNVDVEAATQRGVVVMNTPGGNTISTAGLSFAMILALTRKTPASLEPTIDYVVTKIPRFAFEKFPQADPTLTTQMKSVGEAMAIGRTLKESMQKCLRSLEIGRSDLGGDGKPWRIGAEVCRPQLQRRAAIDSAGRISTG